MVYSTPTNTYCLQAATDIHCIYKHCGFTDSQIMKNLHLIQIKQPNSKKWWSWSWVTVWLTSKNKGVPIRTFPGAVGTSQATGTRYDYLESYDEMFLTLVTWLKNVPIEVYFFPNSILLCYLSSLVWYQYIYTETINLYK